MRWARARGGGQSLGFTQRRERIAAQHDEGQAYGPGNITVAFTDIWTTSSHGEV